MAPRNIPADFVELDEQTRDGFIKRTFEFSINWLEIQADNEGPEALTLDYWVRKGGLGIYYDVYLATG